MYAEYLIVDTYSQVLYKQHMVVQYLITYCAYVQFVIVQYKSFSVLMSVFLHFLGCQTLISRQKMVLWTHKERKLEIKLNILFKIYVNKLIFMDNS